MTGGTKEPKRCQAKKQTLTPAQFRAWLDRRGLTYPVAADLLGVTRRTIANYADLGAARDVPLVVVLALKELDRQLSRRRRRAP